MFCGSLITCIDVIGDDYPNARPCDSVNLNVSPLCMLGKGGGQAQSWAREVKGLYAAACGEIPAYIERYLL